MQAHGPSSSPQNLYFSIVEERQPLFPPHFSPSPHSPAYIHLTHTRTRQLPSSLARPETPLSNPDPTRQNGDLQPSCPRLCPKRRLQTSVILQKRKRDPPSLENPLARPFGSGIVEPKNPKTLSAWPAGGGVCLGFVQSRKLQDTPCPACSNTGLAYDTQLPHSFKLLTVYYPLSWLPRLTMTVMVT